MLFYSVCLDIENQINAVFLNILFYTVPLHNLPVASSHLNENNIKIQKIITTTIIIIIIIIHSFQEDNIFGTYASLTYGPQFTKADMLLRNEHTSKYLQYIAGEKSRYNEQTASGLPLVGYDLSRLKTSI